MIRNDETKGATIKEIRERDKKLKESEQHARCVSLANEKYGEKEVVEAE